ncbi:MAG TPA: nitrogenase component 1 [Negativicutes bacterium]|nr:nitrogenase component 1 [Negativicutes bacterium]
MSYLEQKEPPKREDRLHACIACGGSLSGVVKRMRCCLPDGERGFTQNSICLLLPAMGIMASLPNSVVLMHGASGCGSSAHASNAAVRAGNTQRWGVVKDGIWASTALTEQEVIGGGEDKLAAAIRELDRRFKPDIIFVVAGCVPGIIGDDVNGVATQLQPEVAAKLLPVHCEGFKTKIWATAYDAIYHAVGQVMLKNADQKPATQKQDKPLINLFNVGSMGRIDEIELERLLQTLGFDTNIFPVFAKTENIYRLTQASLSISTCPTHDDYLLQYLEEKFHIPYVFRHMPIGVRNTGEWLRSVGEHFGIQEQVEALIAKEEAELNAALTELKPAFAGKKVFVSAGEFRSLATAILLAELGFDVVAVRAYHHDEFADGEYDKLAAITAKDFAFNIANCQPFEEANLLLREKPDVFLGHMNCNTTAAKLGTVVSPIYNAGLQFMGYQGAYQLARRLHRQLTNSRFNQKLSRWTRLPYQESWYEQNPFAYIKNAEGDE